MFDVNLMSGPIPQNKISLSFSSYNKNLREFLTLRFGSPAHPDLCWFSYRNAIKTFPFKIFSLIDAMLNEKDTRIMWLYINTIFNIVITKIKLNDRNNFINANIFT